MNEVQYTLEYFNQFVDWKIIGSAHEPNDDFCGLVVEKDKQRKVLWVLRDEEGNGPGWLEVQDI